MASPCNNSPDEVIEKIISAKANADKFDKFVNGTDTQAVQLGSGSATPSIRNAVRQIMADASWAKQFIADAPEGDVSLNNATAMGASASRTLAERFADVINVKDFGAVGDGITEDGEAIENAVAVAANGGTVFFPPGIYLCTRKITLPRQNCVFMGSGSASTKILSNGAQAILSADEEQGFANSNLSFFGLTFDGNTFATGSHSAALVRLYACSDIKFHDCVFQNSSGYGLGIQCRAWDSYAEYGVPRYGVAKNIWVDGCAFINNGWSVEGGDTHDGIDIKFGINVNVSNCLFKGNRDCGLDIRGSGLNVTNCVSIENANYGYEFQFEDCGTLLEDAQVSAINNVSNIYSDKDGQALNFIQNTQSTYYSYIVNVSNVVLHDVKSKGVYIDLGNGSIDISNMQITQDSSVTQNRRGVDIKTAKDVNISNTIIDGFSFAVIRVKDGDDETTIRNQKVNLSASNITIKNSVVDFTLQLCRAKIGGYRSGLTKLFALYNTVVSLGSIDFSGVASYGTFEGESSVDIRCPNGASVCWPGLDCRISASHTNGADIVDINGSLHVRKSSGSILPATNGTQKLGDQNYIWKIVYAGDIVANTEYISNKLYFGDVYLDNARVTSLLSLLNS